MLGKLRLRDNALASLPPQMGDMSRMKTLILRENDLTSVPEELGNIPYLSFLYLNENPISSNEQVVIRGFLPSRVNVYF